MRPPQKCFLQRIAALRGLLVSADTLCLNVATRVSLHRNLRCHNLAVLIHTISAIALRAPLALSRAALAAVLTGMPFTGNAAFTINTFAKAST